MPPGWHHGRLRALPDGYDDPDVEDDGWDDDEEDEDWDEEDEDEPDEETWQVGAGQLP